MPAVNILIPNVKNYAEDLNSGAVVVTTMYDANILDQTGTTTDRSKATTGSLALIGTGTFTFSPMNEGVVATYSILLTP
jgi:hypothetical protein